MSIKTGEITLYKNVPVNSLYERTFDFPNDLAGGREAQFFQSLNPFIINNTFWVDEGTIRIAMNYFDALEYNYLKFTNTDGIGRNKTYYAFINNYKSVSLEVTELTIEIDVMQTYRLGVDYNIGESFIVRQHKDRAILIDGTAHRIFDDVEENLELGPTYVETSLITPTKRLNKLGDVRLIITNAPFKSSVGTTVQVDAFRLPFYVYVDFNRSVWFKQETYKNNSPQGVKTFRPNNFNDEDLKDPSVLAIIPMENLPLEDYTIGNGLSNSSPLEMPFPRPSDVNISFEFIETSDARTFMSLRWLMWKETSNSDDYIKGVQLYEGIPISNAINAGTFNHTLSIYNNRIFNNESKIFTSPFRKIYLQSYYGNRTELFPSLMGDDLIKIMYGFTPSIDFREWYFIKDYEEANSDIIISEERSIPVSTDKWLEYLYANKASREAGILADRNSYERSFAKGKLGGITNLIGAGAKGNFLSGVTGGASSIQSLEHLGQSYQDKVMLRVARETDIKNQPDSVANATGDILTQISRGEFGVKIHTVDVMPQYRQMAENYFRQFGYSVKRFEIPNVTSRFWYNYIQIESPNINILTTIPTHHLKRIISIYERGITFHHLRFGIPTIHDFNISYENLEMNIITDRGGNL